MRTSSSVGPACRCRSASDFFSASRIKDISSPRVDACCRPRLQQRRAGAASARIERHLRLDAGDAVDRETMGALELFDQLHQAPIVFTLLAASAQSAAARD